MSAGQPPYLSFIINERPYSIRPVKFSPMLYYERKVLYLPLPKPCPCGPFQILSWHVPERAYVIMYPSYIAKGEPIDAMKFWNKVIRLSRGSMVSYHAVATSNL